MVKPRDTFQRQVSAIIAKLLNDIEGLKNIQSLHPFALDKLRKRCIQSIWDSYVVGYNKATAEGKDESIHAAERRAVNS